MGPFECIKIYKTMKGNEARKEEPKTFKQAVEFYLRKHKATDRIVKNYLSSEDEESMGLFESAIEYLKAKQDEQAHRYENDKANRRMSVTNRASSPRGGIPPTDRRGSIKAAGSPRANAAKSPRPMGGSPRTAAGAASPRNAARSPRAGVN